jgi:hypothetical protein
LTWLNNFSGGCSKYLTNALHPLLGPAVDVAAAFPPDPLRYAGGRPCTGSGLAQQEIDHPAPPDMYFFNWRKT